MKCPMLLAVLTIAAPAGAVEPSLIYTPDTFARTKSGVQPGVYQDLSQYASHNGVHDAYYDNTANGTRTLTARNAAPYASGVATTAANGNQSAAASAYADLSTATLGATAVASPITYGPCCQPGNTMNASLADTLYFTNTTAGDVTLSLGFRLDGSIVPAGPAGSVYTNSFTLQLDQLGNIRFAAGPAAGTLANGAHSASFSDTGIYGDSGSNGFTVTRLGAVAGLISTQLLIPSGQSSLGVSGALSIDCAEAYSCDFGHTAAFSVPLSAGLSFTSASGRFLTAGAVPEPASWALLTVGFGAIGLAVRRRDPGSTRAAMAS